MAEITINGVKYTNVPNKKAGTKFSSPLTQSNIGVSQAVQDYVNSTYFYPLVNAIDINWNGIEVDENTYINTTSDLVSYIASKESEIDLSSYATVSYVTSELATKADANNTYTKAEVDEKINAIDLTDYATTTYVNQKIEDLVGTAPETLDTLQELAEALQNDATLAYVTEGLASKADLAYVQSIGEYVDGNNYRITTLEDKLQYDYATMTYVDEKIGAIDLSAYATTTYVTSELANKADVNNTYTKAEVDEKIGAIDLSAYATTSYVTTELDKKANKTDIVQADLLNFDSSSYSYIKNNLIRHHIYSNQDKYNIVFPQNATNAQVFNYNATGNIIIGDNHTLYEAKKYCIMGGYNNQTNNDYEVAFGQYNKTYYDNISGIGTAFSIGNGTGLARHNAFEVRKDGKIYIADTKTDTPYILQDRLNGKADITYVNEKINAIDLSSYATTTYVNEKINAIDLSSYATNSQLDNRTLIGNGGTITTFGEHTLNDITEFDLKVVFNADEGLQIYIHANNIDSNSATLYLYAGSDSQTAQDEYFEVTATYVEQIEEDEKFYYIWHVTCNAPIDSITFTNSDDPTSLNIEFEMSYGSSITVIENFDNYVSKNELSSYNYATTTYVNEKINAIDLSGYATTTYVTSELANKADANNTYTKAEVDAKINAIDLTDYATISYVTTELDKKADLSDIPSAPDLTPYVTYTDANSYYVTVNGSEQVINSVKTFVGNKLINFKQNMSNDKLGFTLYNINEKDVGGLEYRPDTINGNPLISLQHWVTANDTSTYLGFRQTRGNNKYHLLAPIPSDVATIETITDKNYKNFFLPLVFKNGSNKVYTNCAGLVDMASLMPDLNDYATISYVTTELDKKADLSDIPSAPDLTPYVTYTDANSYYAPMTSYNALVARVEELAQWIVSYHTPTPPTPSKQNPTGQWVDSNMNTVYEKPVVCGDTTTYTFTFNGSPSDSWTFTDPSHTGITVNPTTGEITVDGTNMTDSTTTAYIVTANRSEDSQYYAGMYSFGIRVLPQGTNPDFYYEQGTCYLDNSAMSQQSPIIRNTLTTVDHIGYVSSDTAVATVDSYGTIHYVSDGTCTVTATAYDSGNNVLATTTINVICSTV